MQSLFYRRLAMALILLFSATTLVAFSARFGGDVYEIYLNDQLLVRRALHQPLTLKSLPLTQANINDKLTIRYRQCHAPSEGMTGRSISLRDEKGAIVKEWKFGKGSNESVMTIAVKEIFEAQQSVNGELSLYYMSNNLGTAQRLVSI